MIYRTEYEIRKIIREHVKSFGGTYKIRPHYMDTWFYDADGVETYMGNNPVEIADNIANGKI